MTDPQELVDWSPGAIWRRRADKWELLKPTGGAEPTPGEHRPVGGDYTTNDIGAADAAGPDDLAGELGRPRDADGRLGRESARAFYSRGRAYRGSRQQVERLVDELHAAVVRHGWDKEAIGSIRPAFPSEQPVARMPEPELGPNGVRQLAMQTAGRVTALEAAIDEIRKAFGELESYIVDQPAQRRWGRNPR